RPQEYWLSGTYSTRLRFPEQFFDALWPFEQSNEHVRVPHPGQVYFDSLARHCSHVFDRAGGDLLNSNLTLLRILKLKPPPQNSISAVFSQNPTPPTSCFDHMSHPDLQQGQLIKQLPLTSTFGV
ncbi:hypothetical protein PGTUg99_012614, partial [Puccinia graminis f. sp. tritici]